MDKSVSKVDKNDTGEQIAGKKKCSEKDSELKPLMDIIFPARIK